MKVIVILAINFLLEVGHPAVDLGLCLQKALLDIVANDWQVVCVSVLDNRVSEVNHPKVQTINEASLALILRIWVLPRIDPFRSGYWRIRSASRPASRCSICGRSVIMLSKLACILFVCCQLTLFC